MRRDADYVEGHLPGARQLWRDDVESADYPYGGMVASRERVAEVLDSLGIQPGQNVVIYDGVGGCDAARLWWVMRLYGHEEVALLDGGPQAWQHSGSALETTLPEPAARGRFSFAHEPDMTLLATLDDVQHAVQRGVKLVDTRTDDEFSGRRQKNGAARAGRIPESAHFNWGNAVDLNGLGTMKSVQDLKWDLQQAGVDFERPVITYCHTGVRSAHTTFVLREVLGFDRVANYDGSWTEWSHFEELPLVVDQPLNPAL